MHFSPARWATAVTAAALIALPGFALAQTSPTQNPPSQPPTETRPAQPTQSPAQPPAQPQAPQAQTPPSTAPSAQSGQIDAAAAKQHLTEARDALSQLTSMPEAAKLQGDARTKVSALISDFNGLITTQSEWRSAYNKVNDDLTALIGPDSEQSQSQSQGQSQSQTTAGTTGTGTGAATGTSGTTGAAGAAGANASAGSATQLDPAIRGKLVEFRTHMKAFEKAAGGSSAGSSAGSTASSSAMPPAAATSSTSNPANPVTSAQGTSGTAATSGTAGTSADVNSNAAAQQEIAAIEAIMKKSRTGALTKTQAAEIRRHLDALRALLSKS